MIPDAAPESSTTRVDLVDRWHEVVPAGPSWHLRLSCHPGTAVVTLLHGAAYRYMIMRITKQPVRKKKKKAPPQLWTGLGNHPETSASQSFRGQTVRVLVLSVADTLSMDEQAGPAPHRGRVAGGGGESYGG